MSIKKISLQSGVSEAFLSQVENGKRGTPTPKVLKKIAPALRVPYEDLLIAAGYIERQDEDKQRVIDLTDVVFDEDVMLDGELLELTKSERQIIIEFIRSVVKIVNCRQAQT